MLVMKKEALAVCERMKKMRDSVSGVTGVTLVGFSMAPELDTSENSRSLPMTMATLQRIGFLLLVTETESEHI